MATYNRNEIDPIPVIRVGTGFEELDWIYGVTGSKWGIPMGTISLWAGEAGTGKTKTAVAMCNKMASRGMKILFFQAESDLGTFSGKAEHDSFRFGDSRFLNDIKKDILTDRPDIVVVDSVNMIKEFKTGTATIIENIIDEFKDICKEVRSHIILLGQLNQNGSVKGSSALPHLVDIAMDIKKDSLDGHFSIRTGIKHRYGRIGNAYTTGWRHTDSSVECISSNRMNDKRWNPAPKPVVKPIWELSPKKQYDIAHRNNIASGRLKEKKKGFWAKLFEEPTPSILTQEELEILEYNRAMKQMGNDQFRAEADELGGRILGGLILGTIGGKCISKHM